MSTQNDVESSAVEDFFKTFVSVVYGFAASIAVQWWIEDISGPGLPLESWLMYVGSIFVILHFWLICVGTDDVENEIYTLITGNSKRMYVFLLIYALLVSFALAVPPVLMAKTASTNYVMFWQAYLVLAFISFGYDVIALYMLFASLKKIPQADLRTAAANHFTKAYSIWFILDAAILIAAGAFLFLKQQQLVSNLFLAIVFFAVTLISLFGDVIFFHPEFYLYNKNETNPAPNPTLKP